MAGLKVERRGQGAPLVLVHGWGMNAAVWGAVLAPLARRRELHLVELPGHGGSRAVPVPTGADGWVEALLEAVPAGADWLGWSLGGELALAAKRARPEAVGRVVAVAASPRFVRGPGWPHAVEPPVLEAFAEGLAADPEATLGRFFALQARGLAGGRALARRLAEQARSPAPAAEGLRAGLGLLAGLDLRDALATMRPAPAFILGGRDTLVPAAVAGDIAGRCRACRVCPIEDAGHLPFVSHPEAFMARLEECLDDR